MSQDAILLHVFLLIVVHCRMTYVLMVIGQNLTLRLKGSIEDIWLMAFMSLYYFFYQHLLSRIQINRTCPCNQDCWQYLQPILATKTVGLYYFPHRWSDFLNVTSLHTLAFPRLGSFSTVALLLIFDDQTHSHLIPAHEFSSGSFTAHPETSGGPERSWQLAR